MLGKRPYFAMFILLLWEYRKSFRNMSKGIPRLCEVALKFEGKTKLVDIDRVKYSCENSGTHEANTKNPSFSKMLKVLEIVVSILRKVG